MPSGLCLQYITFQCEIGLDRGFDKQRLNFVLLPSPECLGLEIREVYGDGVMSGHNLFEKYNKKWITQSVL